MTTDKIVQLLKSPVEEDRIIVGNWIVRNLRLSEVKSIFDEYGDHNEYPMGDIYLSSGYFKNSGTGEFPYPVVYSEEYTLLLCYQSWLLVPNWGRDFSAHTVKNVEI